jgi:metal-responsive CopG/Arc/MetJ family transcriptional regulator
MPNKPKSTNSESYLGVRIPSTLLEELKDYCDGEDLNQSQVVRRALKKYLDNMEANV